MVNKSVFLCGIILVLLVLICYLFTSVDLGNLQESVQQWSKNKISFLYGDKLNLDKTVEDVQPKLNTNENGIKTTSKTTIHIATNAAQMLGTVTPPYFNDTIESLNGIRVYDWSKPVVINSTCIPLKNIPKTTQICLYNPPENSSFSMIILESGIWDRNLLREFKLLLGRRQDLDFIDIGSNLGLYSLIAAALGHNVVCVEPLQEISPYFHKSVLLNKFQNQITLLANALSDKREFVKMVDKTKDKTSVIAIPADEDDVTIENIASQKVVSAITWKELADFVPFKKVVLKYDVSLSNPQHSLLSEAADLFSTLDIQYVFMHWSHFIIDSSSIFVFLRSQSFIPKKHVFGKPLQLNKFHNWRGGIIWEKAKQ